MAARAADGLGRTPTAGRGGGATGRGAGGLGGRGAALVGPPRIASRTFSSHSGSSVDMWLRTVMPSLLRRSISRRLSKPTSLASSYTRVFCASAMGLTSGVRMMRFLRQEPRETTFRHSQYRPGCTTECLPHLCLRSHAQDRNSGLLTQKRKFANRGFSGIRSQKDGPRRILFESRVHLAIAHAEATRAPCNSQE